MTTLGSAPARVRAPWWPAAASATAVVAAGVILLVALGSSPGAGTLPTILGYAIGAVLPSIFSAIYRAQRNSRRVSPTFRPSPVLDRFVLTCSIVGFLVGLGNAFLLATELAK